MGHQTTFGGSNQGFQLGIIYGQVTSKFHSHVGESTQRLATDLLEIHGYLKKFPKVPPMISVDLNLITRCPGDPVGAAEDEA